jgi:hypothetical protein
MIISEKNSSMWIGSIPVGESRESIWVAAIGTSSIRSNTQSYFSSPDVYTFFWRMYDYIASKQFKPSEAVNVQTSMSSVQNETIDLTDQKLNAYQTLDDLLTNNTTLAETDVSETGNINPPTPAQVDQVIAGLPGSSTVIAAGNAITETEAKAIKGLGDFWTKYKGWIIAAGVLAGLIVAKPYLDTANLLVQKKIKGG